MNTRGLNESAPEPVIRRHVRVFGRVQGVGFRYSAVAEAERLGVTGWVRNMFSGDEVQTEIEGSASAVAEMVEWLRVGPRWCRVTRIEVAEAVPRGDRDYTVVADG